MEVLPNQDDEAHHVLTTFKTFAVVGCSPSPHRPSNEVARFLMDAGFEVIPVNPAAGVILERRCYASLGDVPSEAGVEVVDIFRRSEAAGVHVDEAIEIGAKAVWMQLGVIDEHAAERARAAGLHVLMDRCPAIEYRRLKREGRL